MVSNTTGVGNTKCKHRPNELQTGLVDEIKWPLVDAVTLINRLKVITVSMNAGNNINLHG